MITGVTGFKGGWLAQWLITLGAEVTGYSLDPPSQPSFFKATRLDKDLHFVHGDIRDLGRLQRTLSDHKPEIVFHLAAQALVSLSYTEPHQTYETNVMGTVNLLESVRQTPSVRAVINVTSDKCYENREWIWGYRESDALGGRDPYSSSKGCAELVTNSYLCSFFDPHRFNKDHKVSLASVRAGNVIGGGDWGTDRLLPDAVRALSEGDPVFIRSPKSIRPWQHVLDPLYGYLLLGTRLLKEGPTYGGPWNFGPGDGEICTVENLIQKACLLWGKGSYELDRRDHPHEAGWLRLDSSKARVRLGWKAIYSVEEALQKTMEWYRLFYSGGDPKAMKRVTAAQIKQYMSAQLSC